MGYNEGCKKYLLHILNPGADLGCFNQKSSEKKGTLIKGRQEMGTLIEVV